MTLQRRTIRVAPAVLAVLFAVTSTAADPPATAQVAFRVASEEEPLILVPVTLDGHGPFSFVLDTGASMSMVSPEVAAKLGLAGGQKGSALGAGGGQADVRIVSVKSFAVGSASLSRVDVAAGDLSDIARATGSRIDGIIGYNFLRHFKVTLDYAHRRLTLD